jgi:deazaflavin-dependent oxidoreductase (nitroreductase family)
VEAHRYDWRLDKGEKSRRSKGSKNQARPRECATRSRPTSGPTEPKRTRYATPDFQLWSSPRTGARPGRCARSQSYEKDDQYAIVASKGGSPTHPLWYLNLLAHLDEVTLQDGREAIDVTVRELTGDERQVWWERAVEEYPPYEEYQTRADRVIPALLATPAH